MRSSKIVKREKVSSYTAQLPKVQHRSRWFKYIPTAAPPVK